MNNKLLKKIKFTLVGGKAMPIPPVSKLSEYNINVSIFCKQYNDLTKELTGTIIPVEIYIYDNKTFTLNLKTPLTSFLILQNINLKKGSSESNNKKIGNITRDKVLEIAKLKLKDLNTNNLDKAVKIIEGSAKSLGLNLI